MSPFPIPKREVTVVCSKRDVRKIVNYVFRRWYLRKIDIFMLLFLLAGCVSIIVNRKAAPLWQVLLSCTIFIGLAWYIRWRGLLRILKQLRNSYEGLPDREAKITFEEDAVITVSVRGEKKLFWKDMSEAWASQRLLLVFTKDNHFVPLPLSQIREDLRAYLFKKIEDERIPLREVVQIRM